MRSESTSPRRPDNPTTSGFSRRDPYAAPPVSPKKGMPVNRHANGAASWKVPTACWVPPDRFGADSDGYTPSPTGRFRRYPAAETHLGKGLESTHPGRSPPPP